ncbi:MAG: hypothetical protein Q9214_003443 [Letrouitia sp. 1 TL-2023]
MAPLWLPGALNFLLLLCLTSAYTNLSDASLRSLPDPGDDFDVKTGKLLFPILRPRVPGTPGSIFVQNHIIDFFNRSLPEWRIELQNSTSKTPTSGKKEIPFVNLIMTRDPPWATPGFSGRLTLAAHYDSKLTPDGFIGAIDSAAPCAMIMHVARSINEALTKKWSKMQNEGLGLEFEEDQGIQILFLDGEEAFKVWTAEDSLYGARSLAAEMEQSPYPAQSSYRNAIDAISLFILLDLLGAKNPNVPSYFKTTHWAYKKMAQIEQRLRSLSLFDSAQKEKSKPPSPPFLPDQKKDEGKWIGGMIEDDHMPFMERGVDVLHIIPSPFPRVWHNIEDNGANLDLPTVKDWSKLVTAFVGEWMELEGFFDIPKQGAKKKRDQASGDQDQIISKTEL